jgi:hypothetical protein
MFTLPGKSQILWTIVIALAVVAIVSRSSMIYKLVAGKNAPVAGPTP